MSESVVESPDAQDRPLNRANNRIGDILFGKFKISGLVQENGYGSMFAAQDLSSGTPVLIEALKTHIPAGLNNFASLAKDVFKLKHENVLQLIAYEEVESRPYFVWEFVDFVRLEDLVDGGGFIEQEIEIFDTLSQVCRGLQFAHDNGMAHGYLHPRNICLADADGEICVKIANFGFSHLQQQLRAFESAGVITHPKPESDVYQLAVLAFYTVTGEPPDPNKSLDDILNPRAVEKISFDALPEHRSDMRAFEEFTQLLDDTIDPDLEWRLKTAGEFENGLIDWIESVKGAEATRSQVVDKLSDETTPPEPLVKKKKKITNNMRTTVRAMVNLKSKQSVQEETAVMKLTNIAAATGPRQSPMASAIKLSAVLIGCLSVVGIALYAAFVKPEETRQLFVASSEGVASLIKPAKPKEEVLLEPVNIPAIPLKSGAKEAVQATVAQLPQVPATRLPKFDPNVLRDLYRDDFVSTNNQGRRAFRIEYREFRKDWISN
jgi:serine/threonine protein kinase